MADIDFDICAEFPFTRTSVRRALFSDLGGIRQVRQVNQRERRVFVLVWDKAPLQLQRRIKAIWADTYGPVRAMNFTPPGESELEVRFRKDSLSRVYSSAASGSLELELEEVL